MDPWPTRPAAQSFRTRCSSCAKDVDCTFPLPSDTRPVQLLCCLCNHVFTVEKSDLKELVPASSQQDQPRSSTSKFSGSSSKKPSNNTSSTSANTNSATAFGKVGSDESPLDMDYYNLLGVPANATPAQIKKAYYMMAMKYHPDKNTTDSDAEEKFKGISEAYQILFDPQKRAHYNKYGKSTSAADGGAFVDPEEFFKQQFGGDKFVDIIGEISIARDFKDAMNSSNSSSSSNPSDSTPGKDGKPNGSSSTESVPESSLTMEERIAIRKKRIETLSNKLIEKLALYTDAFPIFDPEETPIGTSTQLIAYEAMQSFTSIVKMEAGQLKTENHGVELLKAIGFTYVLKAEQYLAKMDTEEGNVLKRAWGFGSRITGMVREKAHIVSETYGTLKTAVDLQASFTKLQELEKKREEKEAITGQPVEMTQEEQDLRRQLETEAATKGMEALWRGSKLEVESVLREVCDAVLGGNQTHREILKRRADALKVLGQVYQNCSV